MTAHARLLELLPGAQATVAAPYDLTPDSIAAAAAGVPVETVLLSNPWRADPAGRGVTPWQDWTDAAVLTELFADRPSEPGPVWFVPDDCFGRREFRGLTPCRPSSPLSTPYSTRRPGPGR